MGEVTRHVERVAMFIVKNNAAVGWHARGFDHSEAVKALTIPLTADTVFRLAHGSRSATRGHIGHSPATAQALARLGGSPQGLLAVPLILRDKVAAILYCDTTQDEMPAATADLVEIMVAYAGKVIDILSAAPKTSHGVGRNEPRDAAERSGGTRPRGFQARAPACVPPRSRADRSRPRRRPVLPPPRRCAPPSLPHPRRHRPRRPRERRSRRRTRRPTRTPSASRAWW